MLRHRCYRPLFVSDGIIQVLLVYRGTIAKQSLRLENLICQVFENRAFTEKKIMLPQDEPIQLEWPIFLAKQQTMLGSVSWNLRAVWLSETGPTSVILRFMLKRIVKKLTILCLNSRHSKIRALNSTFKSMFQTTH